MTTWDPGHDPLGPRAPPARPDYGPPPCANASRSTRVENPSASPSVSYAHCLRRPRRPSAVRCHVPCEYPAALAATVRETGRTIAAIPRHALIIALMSPRHRGPSTPTTRSSSTHYDAPHACAAVLLCCRAAIPPPARLPAYPAVLQEDPVGLRAIASVVTELRALAARARPFSIVPPRHSALPRARPTAVLAPARDASQITLQLRAFASDAPPARADVAPPLRDIEAYEALLQHPMILVLHAPLLTSSLGCAGCDPSCQTAPPSWRADVASPPRAIEAHNALLQHFMIFDLHAPAANFFAGLRLRVRRHPPARADVAPPPRAIEAQTALLYHSLILVLHAPCFTCLLDAIPAGHPMPIPHLQPAPIQPAPIQCVLRALSAPTKPPASMLRWLSCVPRIPSLLTSAVAPGAKIRSAPRPPRLAHPTRSRPAGPPRPVDADERPSGEIWRAGGDRVTWQSLDLPHEGHSCTMKSWELRRATTPRESQFLHPATSSPPYASSHVCTYRRNAARGNAQLWDEYTLTFHDNLPAQKLSRIMKLVTEYESEIFAITSNLERLTVGVHTWDSLFGDSFQPNTWELPLAQLTEFCAPNILICQSECLVIFEQCVNLEVCIIHCYDSEGGHNLLETLITVPELRKLHITVWDMHSVFWGSLFEEYNNPNTPVDPELFTDFRHSCSSSSTFLSESPTVEELTLRLHGPNMSPAHPYDRLVHELACQDNPLVPPMLLPNLHTIRMDATWSTLGMISSRCPIGLPSGDVTLYVKEPFNTADVFPDVINAMRTSGTQVSVEAMDFYGAAELDASAADEGDTASGENPDVDDGDISPELRIATVVSAVAIRGIRRIRDSGRHLYLNAAVAELKLALARE
ncbi:hypothetical protein C8J57DRAFT_1260654 [Mycena rebaudengoi]|nr:hypothetical protein C8J57DRAFT_1260654 [Mycena rebaudengoi]